MMFTLAEPFLTAEISYRQQRVRDQFHAGPGRRRHRVGRRRTLSLPHTSRRPLSLA